MGVAEKFRIFWLLVLLTFTGAAAEKGALARDDVALDARIEALVAEFEADVNAPQIEPEELMAGGKRPDPGVVFVDVRTSAERQVSTLPGALDRDEWRKRSNEGPLPVRVVVYCTIGYRSSLFAERIGPKLAGEGVRVFNLRGGILKWIARGGEVVDSNGEQTKHVHVFGSHWKALPAEYVAHEYSALRLLWEKFFWQLQSV